MLGAFWNSVGGKIADRWATVAAGALVFWLGGLLAWALGHGGFSSLKKPADWLAHQPAPTQLALVLAVLLGVAASGVVVQSLTTPAIRAMEGYWPGWLEPIRNLLLKRMARRAEKDDKRWQELAERVLPPAQPTGPDMAAFVRLEQRLHRRPAKPEQLMPTALGNTLRAAESHPVDKYGLDGVSVWPHLWLVVPDATRQELITARAALDSAARACVWGLLFVAFAPWTLLAVRPDSSWQPAPCTGGHPQQPGCSQTWKRPPSTCIERPSTNTCGGHSPPIHRMSGPRAST